LYKDVQVMFDFRDWVGRFYD